MAAREGEDALNQANGAHAPRGEGGVGPLFDRRSDALALADEPIDKRLLPRGGVGLAGARREHAGGNAITPATDTSLGLVDIQNDARREVDVLKEFIWQYVILDPEMAQLQAGHRRAVRLVFREALGAANRGEGHFFPAAFRGRLNNDSSDRGAVRVAADYVAGLTERELLSVYARLQALSS